MKAKNQIFVISGILLLLATATIASSYIAQPAKAASNDFGNAVSGSAQHSQGSWGSAVSDCAQGNNCNRDTHNGISDLRSNGCKLGADSGKQC